MTKLFSAAFLTFILVFSIFSQSTVQMFEPRFISDDGVFGLTVSPDGNEAFWVSSGGKREKLVIMQSKKRRGKWSEPQIAAFSGKEGWRDIDPMFSPDGETVLFQSNRPVEGFPNRKGFDIWAVKKTKNGWSDPFNLAEINSDASESYASTAKNGNIYFMKENENGTGKSDIYFAEFKNGKYQTPRNLGSPVNTNERESNPFISPDEDYLLYFSDDPKGFGDVDLYISFNNKGNWQPPQNLGKTVNSELAEFCPFVHKKQNRLYLSRQKKDGERFIENVYYLDNFKGLLKTLKKQNK